MGVVDDYLIMANHASLYEKVVATLDDSGAENLAKSLDYRLIANRIARRSGRSGPSMVSFTRPEENLRYFYDLATSVRSGDELRRRAGDNPILKAAAAALESNPLPPFEVLERYLAPGGAMLVDDETGLHYMSFTLRRGQPKK